MANQLYYGDNLDVMRRYIANESIDLVYLDPPFNSNATYSALFGEQDGTRSAAQIRAFKDTWEWDASAAAAYEQIVEQGGSVAQAMIAFRTLIPASNMLAYLSMMAPRLMELRRVLKPTGSLYLHCDPTASHYLKILLDAIFGTSRFKNEITWKRTQAVKTNSSQGAKFFGRNTDALLFYTKTDQSHFVQPRSQYTDKQLKAFKHMELDGRRFADVPMDGPGGAAKGNPEYEVLGVKRFWRFSEAEMERLLAENRVWQSKPGITVPRQKQYLDEAEGVAVQALWDDIPGLTSKSAERLGYPTQKPLALLERIISASSRPGDIVLDPFCGCGTAVDAAQKLGRTWIGIDITHLSINLIKSRLVASYGSDAKWLTTGEPQDVESARQLAAEDPYQFQFWALGLVGARPVEEKKGADKGIDGRLYFHDEQNGPTKQIIFSVKAGKNIHRNMVHELGGVVQREGASIGVLITMESATKPMREEAASGGFYSGPFGSQHPRLQLITVGDLLSGMHLDTPGLFAKNTTIREARNVPRSTRSRAAHDATLFEAD